LLTPSAVTGLVKKWSFPTGGEVESSPAVANGIVYFGSTDTHLYAVDATTGALVWRLDPGDAIVSSPTVSDGVVYLGTMGGGLFALDAATVHVDWGVTMDGPIESSPEVVGGIVYLTTTTISTILPWTRPQARSSPIAGTRASARSPCVRTA
jgi:outer membrane protein assembly factor BamB